MLFNSLNFLIFFPVVTLVYFIIPFKVQYIWLLVASYYFYMCWNPQYALLIAFSTVVTWLCGILVKRSEAPDGSNTYRQKIWIALSFTVNLMILFFFKYFYFAFGSLNTVLGIAGISLAQPTFDVLLPVGISFYTFQALGYTVDVYRNDVRVEKNILRYALFVSFFPQLVAGPIERSSNLLGQFYEKHSFEYNRVKNGLLLMLWGLFKKIMIADHCALLVDQVFDNYQSYAGFTVVVAVLFFAVQIYCDFSGYTDIAIGCAQVMGFQLMENFRQPYFSRAVGEFWRRWHISLSSWFRDYLYIPLGGNRKGKAQKYVNLMITFLVSGLWHGASWSYVVWGGMNGLYQVVGEGTQGLRAKALKLARVQTDCFSYRLFQQVLTFILICVTWIFFRANSLSAAVHMCKSVFSTFNAWIFTDESIYRLGLSEFGFKLTLFSILVLALVDSFHNKYPKRSLRDILSRQNLPFRWLVYISSLLFVILFSVYGSGYDASAFIYFQF